ncbi:MAG: hypothetical protein ABI430_01205 [Candidatus Taylorbacteria bacterium]
MEQVLANSAPATTYFSKKGLLFGIISLVLILVSLFQGLIAFPALVFAILAYVKGEKALGLTAIILSIIFFIVIMGFGLYISYGLNEQQLKNLGSASAVNALHTLLK